jgi:hypothetical protein
MMFQVQIDLIVNGDDVFKFVLSKMFYPWLDKFEHEWEYVERLKAFFNNCLNLIKL